jgi:hypothetical protein
VRDNGRTVAQYDLTLPDDDHPEFNSVVTSFHEFQIGELARSQKSSVRRAVSVTAWNDAQEAKLTRTGCQQVGSVWDLYKAIDYCPQRQKYIK